MRRIDLPALLVLLAVLGLAVGARVWYLAVCADHAENEGPVKVQEGPRVLTGLPADTALNGHTPPTELDNLVENLNEYSWFGSLAPLAQTEEKTAHVAPGYPWLLHWLQLAPVRFGSVEQTIRWTQCGLGALAALFYALLALLLFKSRSVALLAGIFCALNPFWIASTPQIADGVVATFLLSACLLLAVWVSETGAILSSLVLGVALACLVLVRAAFVPFALASLVWLLLRSGVTRRGWLCALLALLGFANGVAIWSIRNYKTFHQIVPIVDSAPLHLWEGNNPRSNGGPMSEQAMLAELTRAAGKDPSKAEDLNQTAASYAEMSQPQRYLRLGRAAWQQLAADPAAWFKQRLESGISFCLGQQFLKDRTIWRQTGPFPDQAPSWLAPSVPALLLGFAFGMLALGILGWRWTFAWRPGSIPLALAIVWVPLPYILGHAGVLSGPRLPLDGVLLCLAAFALCSLYPPLAVYLLGGSATREEDPSKAF